MHREYGEPVVESGDIVHRSATEQMTSQRCRARVAHEARRDHEADPATRRDQLKSPFDKELIQVRVGTALDTVDAGVPDEFGQLPRVETPLLLRVVAAAVAADHVPGWVPDDGVEALWPCTIGRVREDVGKCQRPMEKTVSRGNSPGLLEQPHGGVRRERARAIQQPADEIEEHGAIRRRALIPEPGSAPEIERLGPVRQRRAPRLQRLDRSFLRPHDRHCIVRLGGDLRHDGGRVRQRLGQVALVEQRQSFLASSASATTRLSAQIFRGGADEAVSRDEVVIEERERFVGREGCEPQRQARQLHGHRIQVDPEQASRRNLAPKGHAIGRRDVVRVPLAFLNECVFGGGCQVAARGDQEGTAPHRGIEHAKRQNLVSPTSSNQRLEGAPHEKRGHGARRVERAARLAQVARACERRRAACCRLVFKHPLVHRAKLLDVEVAVEDSRPAAVPADRRAAQ